jgi:diaminopropionate ammonia-lyase
LQSDYLHHRHQDRLTPPKAAAAQPCVENLSHWQHAVAEVHTWPEYSPQPLHSLDHSAKSLGIHRLYYKDESRRFGTTLGSFKALGAPYAVYSLLADHVAESTGIRPTAQQLRNRDFLSITSRITVCVATDGNQGRGLAYAALTFGCRCVTYIHSHVSPHRKEAMEELGAIVIRIDGEYENSVQRARQDARLNGWHFVSSTSWDDFASPIPRNVMNAYMVMVKEALDQIPDPNAITHVFMQGGVGSIAAAVFLGFMDRRPTYPPNFIMVEPIEADCLYQTAVHGQPTPSKGTLRTIMAGLACREVSPAAWKVLDWLTSDFLAIPDSWAATAMQQLAQGAGDIPIVCGESAAGGMGTLMAAASNPNLYEQLGLSQNSQCVLFGCEGATDPTIYKDITGFSPDEVFSCQPFIPAMLVP